MHASSSTDTVGSSSADAMRVMEQVDKAAAESAALSSQLEAERKRLAEMTCSVYEMLLLHKEEEHRQILQKLPLLLPFQRHRAVQDVPSLERFWLGAIHDCCLDVGSEVIRA